MNTQQKFENALKELLENFSGDYMRLQESFNSPMIADYSAELGTEEGLTLKISIKMEGPDEIQI